MMNHVSLINGWTTRDELATDELPLNPLRNLNGKTIACLRYVQN